MRQFHSCQQRQQQQQPSPPQAKSHVRPSAHVPDHAAAAPAIDDALDQAAALWTTRRIRSFFLLLDPNAGPKQR
ncbi:hypothetical protein J7E49_16040 [Variovorax paradoxus]|nr:hypothetical protein [Variovorax paradoxus]